MNIHLGELGRVTTSNLLCAKSNKLLLGLLELLVEVLLALSPKLGCLDLSCGLFSFCQHIVLLYLCDKWPYHFER